MAYMEIREARHIVRQRINEDIATFSEGVEWLHSVLTRDPTLTEDGALQGAFRALARASEARTRAGRLKFVLASMGGVELWEGEDNPVRDLHRVTLDRLRGICPHAMTPHDCLAKECVR